jgi:hypothetical protein
VQCLFSAEQGTTGVVFDQDTAFPFYDKIQHLSENFENGIAHKMLQSYSCNNLTNLQVEDFDHDIVSVLKNAPNLLSLSLTTYISSFNTLNTIHKSAPRLQHLKLRTIDMKNTSLDNVDPSPVESLTERVFDEVETDNDTTLLNILKYITMKYISLTKLKFCISQRNRLMYNDIVDLNQSGLDPLFKKLGHQLKTLGLGGNTFEQQFSSLDDSGCRIKHITINCKTSTILFQLAASNQTSCIQTLVLEAMNSGSLLALTKFKSLVRLKLDANFTHKKDYAVSFPNILKYAPPTLKSLSISSSLLAIDSNYEYVSHSIEKVSLSLIDLPNDIDAFLSRCIPNISYLKLEYCGMVGKTLNLAKLDLYKFRIIDQFEGHALSNRMMVLTLGNHGRGWCDIGGQVNIEFIDKLVRAFYTPFKTWPIEDIDTEPAFTLICSSLKNIAFH